MYFRGSERNSLHSVKVCLCSELILSTQRQWRDNQGWTLDLDGARFEWQLIRLVNMTLSWFLASINSSKLPGTLRAQSRCSDRHGLGLHLSCPCGRVFAKVATIIPLSISMSLSTRTWGLPSDLFWQMTCGKCDTRSRNQKSVCAWEFSPLLFLLGLFKNHHHRNKPGLASWMMRDTWSNHLVTPTDLEPTARHWEWPSYSSQPAHSKNHPAKPLIIRNNKCLLF